MKCQIIESVNERWDYEDNIWFEIIDKDTTKRRILCHVASDSSYLYNDCKTTYRYIVIDSIWNSKERDWVSAKVIPHGYIINQLTHTSHKYPIENVEYYETTFHDLTNEIDWHCDRFESREELNDWFRSFSKKWGYRLKFNGTN